MERCAGDTGSPVFSSYNSPESSSAQPSKPKGTTGDPNHCALHNDVHNISSEERSDSEHGVEVVLRGVDIVYPDRVVLARYEGVLPLDKRTAEQIREFLSMTQTRDNRGREDYFEEWTFRNEQYLLVLSRVGGRSDFAEGCWVTLYEFRRLQERNVQCPLGSLEGLTAVELSRSDAVKLVVFAQESERHRCELVMEVTGRQMVCWSDSWLKPTPGRRVRSST